MIHLDIHGFSWGIAYWAAVVAVGVVLETDNLRHAWRQVRSARRGGSDRMTLAASTLGHLGLHLVIAVGLVVSGVPAVLIQVAALAAIQSLDFANLTSAVAFLAVTLGLVSGPTAAAVAAWFWRWNTTRVDRQTRATTIKEGRMPNQEAIDALLVTQEQLDGAAGAIEEAKAKVDAALAALRAEGPSTITLGSGGGMTISGVESDG